MRLTAAYLLVVCALGTTSALAQSSNQTVTLTAEAPVFAEPDDLLAPLRIGKEGSVLRLLSLNGDWCRVEYQDPQLGVRVGFVQTKNVRTSASVEPPIQRPPQFPGGPTTPVPTTQPVTVGQSIVPVRSRSSGFFVGSMYEGNGIVTGSSSSTAESGVGGGVVLGYGFSPRWSLYGELSLADINAIGGGSYSLVHIDVGPRLHWRAPTNRTIPFFQFGLSARGEGVTVGSNTASASGAGVFFGGGVNVHVVPALAFSGGVTWSVGAFTDYRVNGRTISGSDVTATSARVQLGILWFPTSGSRRTN